MFKAWPQGTLTTAGVWLFESKRNKINEERKLCLRHNERECMCVCVCVSEMDRQWPGNINALSDWLRLSRNVTGTRDQDLIGIWELLLCN